MRTRLFIALLMIIAFQGVGQQVYMEQITIEDGLPANHITDLAQDSVGFMWIVSNKGITRYDGSSYYHYPNSLLGNDQFTGSYALRLFRDAKGGIWTTTQAGAVLSYDPVLDRFQVRNDSSSRLPSLAYSYYQDDSGDFWFGTAGDGLVHWEREKSTIKQYQMFAHRDSLPDNFISFISPLNDSLLYMTTTKGSAILDKNADRFFRLWFNASNGESYKHNVLRHSIRHNGYAYTSSYGGLHIADLETNAIEHLTTSTTHRPTINHNSIWELAVDREGKIWITTYGGGVNIYDPESREFTYLTTENSDLPENNVQGIFIDGDENVWLRTASSGLIKIDHRKQWIRHIDFKDRGWPAMTSGFIEEDSLLWIGTNGGGLIRFDLKTGTALQYLHDPEDLNSLGYNHITSMDQDHLGRIWIATGGAGMDMFDPVKETFTHHPNAPDDLGVSNAALKNIICYDSLVYWVTYGNGFGIYNTLTDSYTSFMSSGDTGTDGEIKETNVILRDMNGNEWVATESGLIMRLSGEDDFKDVISPNSVEIPLSSLNITFLSEEEGGRYVLMNSVGELLRFSLEDNGSFRFDNLLYDVPEQSEQMIYLTSEEIWTVSSQGVHRKVLSDKMEIVYEEEDGLLGTEFTWLAGPPRSEVLVPSQKGLNILDIAHIPDTPHPPRVIFHELMVLNRPVIIQSPDSIHGLELQQHLNYTDKITLEYGHKVFSLSFNALQFYAPGAPDFRYRLKGFRDTWVERVKDQRVSYTNLDPGDYTFEVQASIVPGEWGPVKSLDIHINPPFWMTWWFVMLILILLIGLLYLFHSYRIQKAVAVANLRTQIAQDLHDDIGASLTKISLYSSLIEEDGKHNGFVDQIGSLSREVISQMSDIVWSVDQKNDTIGDLVMRMRHFGEETLEHCGMKATIEVKVTDERTTLNPLVRQNYYLIFKEAINNICKHSQAKHVWIRLNQKHRQLEMEIVDDGIGMQEALDQRIRIKPDGRPVSSGNGMTNMKKRAERIGVSFKVHSNKDSGTTVHVGTPA